MLNDLFRFVGEDGSLGYQHGKIYLLEVVGRGVTDKGILVTNPIRCPYDSYEAFFKNWERVGAVEQFAMQLKREFENDNPGTYVTKKALKEVESKLK